MREETSIQRDLQLLATELKKLEAEYNMFFAGRLPRPPWETRNRVEVLIRRWDRAYIETAIDRFRFSTLQARYSAFVDLWDRAMRAREEGRPGPLTQKPAEAATRAKRDEARVLHVTSFTDPLRETEKLHALYHVLMEARRGLGQDAIPFHRFAALVKDQVEKLRESGSAEVAFRVDRKGDQVSFTARGLKSGKSGKK
jgi:hypothetical protein